MVTIHLLLLSIYPTLLFTTAGGYANCAPASPLRFEYATPLELAKFLVGDGVNVDESSVLFEGYIDNETSTQVAKYFGGTTIFDNNEDMNEGVVLTTGNVNAPLCQSQQAKTEPNPNPNNILSKFDSFAWPKQNNINPDLVAMCKSYYTVKQMATQNCDKYQDQSQLSFTFTITENTTLGIVRLSQILSSPLPPPCSVDLFSDILFCLNLNCRLPLLIPCLSVQFFCFFSKIINLLVVNTTEVRVCKRGMARLRF